MTFEEVIVLMGLVALFLFYIIGKVRGKEKGYERGFQGCIEASRYVLEPEIAKPEIAKPEIDEEAEFSIHPEDLRRLIDKHEEGHTLTYPEIRTLVITLEMFHKKANHWELRFSEVSRLLVKCRMKVNTLYETVDRIYNAASAVKKTKEEIVRDVVSICNKTRLEGEN